MSIVRMKRLRLAASSSEKDRIMQALALFGAVELTETEVSDVPISSASSESETYREKMREISDAIDIAKKRSGIKRGMFSKRPETTEKTIFSSEFADEALILARKINSKEEALSIKNDRRVRLEALEKSMQPWEPLGISLDTPQGKRFGTMLLTIPSSVSFESASSALSETSEYAELFEVSRDAELCYMLLVTYTADTDKAFSALKLLGAVNVKFRDVSKTAKEVREDAFSEISEIRKEAEELEREITVTDEEFDTLLIAQDAISTRLACEVETEKGLSTVHSFYIEGWFPKREEKKLVELLEKNGCAYEFSDPVEGDDPPTLTYNSKLIAPFEVITNMYSAPAYHGVDPNPMMAPFFALFFGIMLSDAGYGLLLMIAGIFSLWKMKPRGGFRSFMQLAIICGASTVLWGLMFGGFFGDAIPSIYLLFTGKTFPYDLALWFNPTNDPMTMLIFSLALGGIQIVAGMAVKGYMMIRDGEVWAAIFDIGFWWVAFAGVVVMLLGSSTVGLYIILAGVAGLVLTQGRAKKNIIMKFFGGILSLYDVTSYFSDMLSYSRLLALSLATAVVGTVINTMGILVGPIGFFVVFIIGHVFNIAINLVGSFVHAARLQYVEFFGKFYESGGKLFKPLSIKSKNTDIIKEEI